MLSKQSSNRNAIVFSFFIRFYIRWNGEFSTDVALGNSLKFKLFLCLEMERGISFAFYLDDPEKYKDIKIELVLNLTFL